MEFLDLTPYRYLPTPLPMVSLGWLGPEHGIQGSDRKPMEAAEIERLLTASTHPVALTLGWHDCEFCPEGTAFQGNGEYHYYLSNGDVYAAPAMLLHYVQEHGYRLPEEFREALGRTGELAWDDRAEHLRRILADRTADIVDRDRAITDLANWRDPRAYQALLATFEDQELVDMLSPQIGQSLKFFLGCDFAADLDVDGLPPGVKYGIDLH